MRILVHDYAGHPFQVQLSRALAGQGHEVKHAFAAALQTPRGELQVRDSDPAQFSVTEVPMHRDYAKHKYSFVRRRGMEIAYGHEVARLIRDWKPDVVLSSNTPTETQGPILASSKAAGARFAYWVQDFYSIAVDKFARKKLPVLGSVVGGYYRYLDRKQFRKSDHVVAITEDFKPLLTNDFGVDDEKVAVIPNWAPIDSLPVLPKDNAWSREHDLADKFVFLYTGTLGMKHNPDLLLQLAIDQQHDPDVRIVVISEGIGANWLAERIAQHGLKNLVLFPYQPFDRLPEVLASGDVLTGVLEEDAGIFSVPSKVLTYLCAQRALLLAVPEVNLAARIIREEDAGLTVTPSDVDGYLDSARLLLEDKALRSRKAINSRNYAEKTFKIEDIVIKFENILKN